MDRKWLAILSAANRQLVGKESTNARIDDIRYEPRREMSCRHGPPRDNHSRPQCYEKVILNYASYQLYLDQKTRIMSIPEIFDCVKKASGECTSSLLTNTEMILLGGIDSALSIYKVIIDYGAWTRILIDKHSIYSTLRTAHFSWRRKPIHLCFSPKCFSESLPSKNITKLFFNLANFHGHHCVFHMRFFFYCWILSACVLISQI